jgi:glycosyltransferase involved in cell wall biosynthesis
MKFSVLLPTRNGGALLTNCILSILEQDHDDFELVISDNANTDATPDIIRSFDGDPRLKVVRQVKTISVSENWTATLKAASGDYFLMMGDDDYLLPGALRRLDETLTRHNNPDCVLYNGYSYVSPKAIADNSESYWAREHYHYGPDFICEGIIDRAHRMGIVYDMFRFRQRIPLNMQTTLFARRAIEQLNGDVFHAPFPDHYLLNALLLIADTWVYLPERLVVVGVSPKSFGHYFYSQNADSGLAYLGINTHFPGELSGSVLLNGVYVWLLDLKAHYPKELEGVEIDRSSYVRGQIYTWLQQFRYGGLSTRELAVRLGCLSFDDGCRLVTTIFDAMSWRYLGRFLRIRKKSQAEILWHGLMPLSGIADIREFAAWLGNHSEECQ